MSPAIDAVLTIAPPPPWAIIWRAACFVPRKTERVLIANVASQASTVCSVIGPNAPPTPALLNQRVEMPELVDRGHGEGLDVGFERDVALDEPDRGTEGGDDIRTAVSIEVTDHHRATLGDDARRSRARCRHHHPSRPPPVRSTTPWTAQYDPAYCGLVPGRDEWTRRSWADAYRTDDMDDTIGRDAFDLVEFTDEELTELALDADPFDPFDPEVESIDVVRKR